ncbi:MAG: PRTRC system protein C [Methylophilus sp.]|uniref:PRTRC system protein C n=1 Tax=Methylophilus sp. TaxID=29541 RepID=UPI003FA12489
MVTATFLTRSFMYAGAKLVDIDPEMSPDDVRLHYAALYPELLNAVVGGSQHIGTELVFTFEKSVGVKG